MFQRRLFLLFLVALGCSAAETTVPAAGCDPKTLKVVKESSAGSATFRTSTGGALKDTITVIVKNLSACLEKSGDKIPAFVLYLDGKPLKGLTVTIPPRGHEHLNFFLDRISDNRVSWSALLRDPTLKPRRVSLSIGLDSGPPVETEVDDFQLTIINGGWLTAWGVLLLFILALFMWAAASSDLLRDGGPEPPPDSDGRQPRKAFSLGRCQMAWWFFLILAAFCLIYMVTWDTNSITQGVLALMGISGGTALAGAIVDKSKTSAAASEKQQLLNRRPSLVAEVQASLAGALSSPLYGNPLPSNAPSAQKLSDLDDQVKSLDTQVATSPTEDFFIDILSDATGLSFHRFQMFTWTIVLGIIFAISVRHDLVMPDFGATLLGLMGISSGTYIGFKFPEQKNPNPQPAPASPPTP